MDNEKQWAEDEAAMKKIRVVEPRIDPMTLSHILAVVAILAMALITLHYGVQSSPGGAFSHDYAWVDDHWVWNSPKPKPSQIACMSPGDCARLGGFWHWCNNCGCHGFCTFGEKPSSDAARDIAKTY